MKKILKQIFNKKNISLSEENGFSLMETLVAIFILLISTTGPMVFGQNALRTAFQSRDQITAFNLAQDAIEFIKNRRDHNSLSGGGWLDDLGDCFNDDGCTVDTVDLDNPEGHITSCEGIGSNTPGCLAEESEDDVPLNLNLEGYLTNKTGGSPSIFSRTVYMNNLSSDHNGDENVEAEIVVKVRWTSHDSIGVREIVVVENIYNWLDALGI